MACVQLYLVRAIPAQLVLRYMPTSADIENGDLLVTSGIDEIYPPGIPVATVVKIERRPGLSFCPHYLLADCGVDKHHHLLILSGTPKPPALPAEQTVTKSPVEIAKTKRAK